jgi:RHS repeat-associated protein
MPQTLTQYAYDNANNLICSSVRMNSAVFSSPPVPCVQGTPGTAGPDRITFNTYDAANELTQVTVGYLSTTQVNYATTTYGNNGEVLTVKDGAGNLTTLSYDGYDRLSEVEFPMPTTGSGSSNPSDYESYGYDNNGNLTSKRLRSGQTVTLTYDALNRLTQETFPSGTSLPVYYAYDLLNRVLMVSNISPSGPGIAYAYDALGRATSMTQNGKTLSHAYDAAGNRTGVTWPDTSNPLTATYVYDPLNHVTQIEQNGATSGSGLLAAYSYDGVGRRTAVSRAGGAGLATSYSYDGISRLSALTQTLNSSAGTAFTYGYNPASQVISRADSNGGFTVRPSAISSTYTANGLNQYSTITGVEQTVAAGPQAALTYDPLGRIQAETSSGATSNFLYDGAFLAEEYSTSGTTTARYVPGPGTDEPIVVYSGASLTTPNWYAADEEGSIIATADASANATASYAYGPYGEPITSAGAPAWGGARYRYTGQIEIPGGLSYFYKARMYDPSQGRFFQTDPAGFGGGVNLYAYVLDDPINGWDPTGFNYTTIGNIQCVTTYQDTEIDPNSEYGIIGYAAKTSCTTTGQPNFADQNPNSQFAGPGVPTAPQNTHQYRISVPTLCSPSQAFSDMKDAGMSAPGAPAAQEGFTPRINLAGNNPISQYVNSSTMTIVNSTLPGHVFYPGNVTIQVVPAAGGNSDISITGTRSGNEPLINDAVGYAFFGGVSASSVAQVCSARAGVPGP